MKHEKASGQCPTGVDRADYAAHLDRVAADVYLAQIPNLLADLERLKLLLWARWVAGASPGASNGAAPPEERLLDVQQAARFLGVSRGGCFCGPGVSAIRIEDRRPPRESLVRAG